MGFPITGIRMDTPCEIVMISLFPPDLYKHLISGW